MEGWNYIPTMRAPMKAACKGQHSFMKDTIDDIQYAMAVCVYDTHFPLNCLL